MLQQGSLFDNRYELTQFIGRGGFAEVWLVTDRLTGLEEALKIYAPGGGMDEHGLKLFVKELSVVHDLRHSNLLTPKMLGQFENQPYLILPYCPNGSLNKYVGSCDEELAWKILEQVASGLAYLHQRNIVHQDIKPDNILLDANNDCVITDFGISLKAQSTLRKSMRIQANSGTMDYMAPERFSAEPHPIPANDVWSLGAMMFEMIEGVVPFAAQLGGLAQMNGAQIPTMHAEVSENLKQVIYSMLALNAEERPTAEQVSEMAKGKGTKKQTTKYKAQPKQQEQPVDDKKTQIIQQPVDDKKTQIINTGTTADTYHRPNRFEQETSTSVTNQGQNRDITEAPNSSSSLTLGILALVLPFIGLILGIIGWAMAKHGLNKVRLSPASYTGVGKLKAGLACSIVSVSIYILIVVIYVIAIIIAVTSYY